MRPGLSFRRASGGDAEQPRLFGTSAKSSASMAWATSIGLLLPAPDLDQRAGELALSGEALARENRGLRLKTSTEQFF